MKPDWTLIAISLVGLAMFALFLEAFVRVATT